MTISGNANRTSETPFSATETRLDIKQSSFVFVQDLMTPIESDVCGSQLYLRSPAEMRLTGCTAKLLTNISYTSQNKVQVFPYCQPITENEQTWPGTHWTQGTGFSMRSSHWWRHQRSALANTLQCLEFLYKYLLRTTEVSLSTFIRPSEPSNSPDPNSPWLLLLFIPAAFSFVCPTEVIAFQNCYDEFRDRNCSIAFVSVDTKHSLWHWQNVPRQYGGLGNIDIPLLSDATHKIGRDYGVLVEEEGVSLRGMFIIDNEGLVQQVRPSPSMNARVLFASRPAKQATRSH